MRAINIIAITVLCFAGCRKKEIVPTIEIPCSYSDSSAKHPKHEIFTQLVSKYIKKGLPGVSVLVQDGHGAWIGSGGFADIEEGVKYSPCHISKTASITKLLIGTLVMKLKEQGKIKLDDPISNYISHDILKKISNSGGKTVRQLLNHTSGIYDVITSPEFYMEVLNNPNKRWTQTELLKYIYNRPGVNLNNPYPASYSNSNTILLSMCIESATGQKHETLLRKEILEPLEMHDTYYQGRETIPQEAAQGYFDLHNNGTLVNVSNIITGSGNGFNGTYSNVFDLHKFITALFIDKIILSETSLNEMQQFVKEGIDSYCGLGMIKKYEEKPYYGIGHTGKDLGYTANLFYFPQKKVVMVFFINYGTNGQSGLKPVFLDFEDELINAILN